MIQTRGTEHRVQLPNRRHSNTMQVHYHTISFEVTFGFTSEDEPRIWEVFANPGLGFKEGTDFQATISDACIAISLLLQHGLTIQELADAFGEDRPEGHEHGPASSPLGAIAKAGAASEEILSL